MKQILHWIFAAMTLLAASAHADIELLTRTQSLCRGYTEGFVSPPTDLAYGKRLNGPRGIAVLAALWNLAQSPAEAKSPDPTAKPHRPPGPEYGPQLALKNVGIGPVMDVAATSSHLYAVGGGRLHVLDHSQPDAPRVIGRLSGLGNVRQIAVQDGIAYITSREDGLFLVDVRRPDRPVVASHYDTIELATGIAVSGSVAAVANRLAGVEFVDVSDPNRPRHLSTVRVGEAQSVAFKDGYLVAGVWHSNELAIVDARNPRRPKLVAKAPLDGHGDGVSIRGSLALVATGHHSRARPAAKPDDPGFGRGHGLEIFDVSDPTRPRFLSRLKLPPLYRLGMDMWGVEAAGDYAFVHDTYNGLFVVDVRDPAKPRCLAHCQLPVVKERGDPSPVAGLAGGRVYLAGAWSDLHVVTPGVPAALEPKSDQGLRVTPEAPASLGRRDDVYKPQGQVHAALPWRDDPQGPLLLVAAGTAGLHVVRRNAKFERVAEYPTRGFATDVAFHGDDVYVAEGKGGLSLWKAEPSRELIRTGAYEVPGDSIRQVVLSANGTIAFLAVGTGRLQAIRMTGRNSAAKLIEETHTGLFYRLPISPTPVNDRSVLCQWHATGLYQYEASGDRAGFTGFHYPHSIGSHCGAVAYGDQWLVTSRGGYFQLSVADTRPPEKIGLVHIPGEDLSGKPTLFGDTLFIAHPYSGLVRAVDIADFRRPKLLGKLDLSEHPGFVRLLGDVAMVPAGYQGLLAWDYRRKL